MVVAFRSASIGANLSTALPTGNASGDVLLAQVSTETNGTTPTAATSWNLIGGDTTSEVAGRPLSCHWYWIARGGSAPATNWSTGGAGEPQVGYLCYTGVDNTTPIDVFAISNPGGIDTTTVTWSAITIVTDQSYPVGMVGVNNWQTGTAANWTNERADGGATIAAHFYDQSPQGTGSFASRTETIGGGWQAISLALKPAGAAATKAYPFATRRLQPPLLRR